MSVEFNEENNFAQAYTKSAAPISGITKWIIDKGIAKDEQGAKNVMIIVIIVCFALAIYFSL